MKKLLLATLSVALVVAVIIAAGSNVAFAAEQQTNQTSEYYQFMSDFISNCRDRYGYDRELKAAQYLADKFDALLSGTDAEANILTYGSEQTAQTGNVVVKLNAQNPKTENSGAQIIIGAHYDAESDGANDNASGVAALYFVMSKLLDNYANLPCNVVFIAFGGEERGLLGSYYYVSEMSSAERQNTLLMINIDSIVNGDNLYLFCENKSTSLAKLILQNDKSGAISEKPYAKGTYSTMDMYGYGYYETIQGSDYTPFRLQNIPTAFFFSGNFVGWDYVESTDSNKVTMNSSRDTLENLLATGADIEGRIDSVVTSIVGTVCDEQFISTVENARSELINNAVLFNPWWPRLIAFGILIILAVLAFFYYRKLQKQSILGTAEIKQNSVFDKPQAEDIFSFDNKQTDKNDVDDIFTFKK